MFDRFRRSAREPIKAKYPAGRRMYCIGDIHGRADLLSELHGQIERDASNFEGARQILYVGDYIDRGEQSKEVLDLLIDEPLSGLEPIYLLGNHEQALMDFLIDPVAMAGWLTWGGQATLRSYGIHAPPMPSTKQLQELRDKWELALPAIHLNFLKSCTPHHHEGTYYFVHAGIRPGAALEKQAIEDQLWIREEFTESQSNHGAIIVHGHTISEEVEQLPNRIGIDTGAYKTGVLTALVLEGGEQRLLQTGGTQ